MLYGQPNICGQLRSLSPRYMSVKPSHATTQFINKSLFGWFWLHKNFMKMNVQRAVSFVMLTTTKTSKIHITGLLQRNPPVTGVLATGSAMRKARMYHDVTVSIVSDTEIFPDDSVIPCVARPLDTTFDQQTISFLNLSWDTFSLKMII